MELSSAKKFFLVCSATSTSSLKLDFYDELSEIVPNWECSTRLSPIWLISDETVVDAPPSIRSSVVFVGLVYPLTFNEDLGITMSENTEMFVSLGHFNCVVNTDDDELVINTRKYCKKHSIPFEVWSSGKDGVFASTNINNLTKTNVDVSHTREKLCRLATINGKIQSQPEISEFITLMSSSIARANNHNHAILGSLMKVTEVVCESFIEHLGNTCSEAESRYLTQINAALSRFCSQTFSGTSPVALTECHFWCHSLLGIGLANIALQNLVNFIDDALGQTVFIDRLHSTAEIYEGISDLTGKSANAEYWSTISEKITPNSEDELTVPMISYFSGRDGYLSYHHFISAPLISVSQCASINWSLITLTHEICHIFMQEVVECLFPLDDSLTSKFSYDFNRAGVLLEANETDTLSFLDRLRQYVLTNLLVTNQEYDWSENDIAASEVDLSNIKGHLREATKESEEILVHILDYQLFYGGKADQYIQSIWNTWSVLPDIDYRIIDYIVRTACALLSNELAGHSETTISDCLNKVTSNLKQINHDEFGYIKQAITHLENDNDLNDIKIQVTHYVSVVKVAKYVLYDNSFNSKLYTNSFDNSLFSKGVLSTHKFKSPLEFISENLMRGRNHETDSLWMLTNLAFRIDK